MKHTPEAQMQSTYAKLTFLGLLLHISQTVIFFLLDCPLPGFYNAVSVVFYITMLYTVHLKMYRFTVSAIHTETCIFAIICVISCGWGTGIALFLLAMSSLVYFCPFERKFVPYLFSLMELTVFMALRIYTYYHEPLYGYLPKVPEMFYYIYNTLACFYVILFAAFSSNISAIVTNIRLQSENRNLSVIANSDFLTGLPRRHAFLQRVAALAPSTPVIVAIGDLDNFKNINDSFGHTFGDYVLHTVGDLMNAACNESSISCRWGGEEFVILFHDISLSESIDALDYLRHQISSHIFEYEGCTTHVTITFGACSGTIDFGIEHLIKEADKYLYMGKQNGKNCVFAPK